MFSFNDVERLLQIKALIEKGVNIAGIKQVMNSGNGVSEPTVMNEQSEMKRRELTDQQLHSILKKQLKVKRPGKVLLNQGELSSFFKTK